MKNLHFDYCMEIQYAADVTNCFYTIKCIPENTERQHISNINIEMIPESKPEWAYDSQGNRYIFGCNPLPHAYFKYRITGDALCGINSYEAKTNSNDTMIYRHSHGLTLPGESIKNYHGRLASMIDGFAELSPLGKAVNMMHQLYQDFSYEKNCTTVKTGAEEAFQLGKGVCQDYAHILISLLHLSGCSARYVTGLIIGEGASHAWVEVADQGKWIGIDPTNNMLVGDSHIKIGNGRDASECQINRGIMHGRGAQTQSVYVKVTEMPPSRQFLEKGALV